MVLRTCWSMKISRLVFADYEAFFSVKTESCVKYIKNPEKLKSGEIIDGTHTHEHDDPYGLVICCT